ncbi:TerC family protein [Chloroflexia bacterium SDU3-3]|nr:TerC family protein [Chloroflexia bacterium SDU3-3]
MDVSVWIWVGFIAFVLAMLAIDLGVFNRKAHAPSMREAGMWTVVWVTLAAIFAGVIFLWEGHDAGMQFVTGYLIEYSLSVDNIFVFVLLFGAFRVPPAYQHRVLFWGILGALIMRGAMIILGAALLERFEWIIYVFGAFLVYSGLKLIFQGDEEEEVHPEGNLLVRIVRRFLPVAQDYHGERFLVRQGGKLMITPLLIVLLIVESTDLIFAVDSIPAIFAVTRDPFLVFTSNVFAILGLRSLYFLLANVVGKFYYLRHALSVILTFVGIKMLWPEITVLLTGEAHHISIGLSLSVILGALALAVLASFIRARRQPAEPDAPADAPAEPVLHG